MTITLTREEAQQVLDALEGVKDMAWDSDTVAGRKLIETLRAKLAEPEPEPVAWLNKLGNGAWIADVLKCEGDEPSEPLYTAPPQRDWQGLTDDEKEDMLKGSKNAYDAIERIEAKLKEKNAC